MPMAKGVGPERVLQIGEGRFLRGFVDWILAQLQRQGRYDGRVVVVFPRSANPAAREAWNRQQGQFSVVVCGIEAGHPVFRIDPVRVVSRTIDPHREWIAFLDTATLPTMEVLISNTTEAGLVWLDEGYVADQAPQSVAGKITAWLYRRFQAFNGAADRGMEIVPCELIDQNGTTLRTLVLRYAEAWHLPAAFRQWVTEANRFYNTLVDSIVTSWVDDGSHPELSEDALAVVREPYYRWLLEGPPTLGERWHLTRDAGLAVDFVPDLEPYRELKVRVLNGAHTAMAGLGLLMGLSTVREAVTHRTMASFIDALLRREVLPTLAAHGIAESEVTAFIETVLERFSNPYLVHRLEDIQLNADWKVYTRLWPSWQDYHNLTGHVPPLLTLAMAGQKRWLETQGTDNPFAAWPLGEAARDLLDAAVQAASDDLRTSPESAIGHTLNQTIGS
ncbi:altronate oxidoreductase [Sulfobacillus acidophilus TPY]|uniref:Tagaturonate reductase n=1 Tax=Sulfobacillus acidophilus (strain ATCC 700253 / DSM 10332 / NAL) TaxID=679936 RepID=G8TTI1_SULAD|nr:altronate oxidoreductase [Sulfobacillus acidophilus TPY]AEW05647.1 tagaturonate reductase [Sulfobacillus acidophilus DSM 10332]